MDKFWQFAKMMLDYRRLLGAALVGVLIDAVCQLGGFGTITWVVQQFLDKGVTIHDILTQKLTALRDDHGYDLTGLLAFIPDDAWWGLVATLGLVLVLALIGSVGRFVHEYATITVSLRTVMRIRGRVFSRLVHLPMSTATHEKTAEQVSRVVRDCTALGRGFSALTARAVRGVVVGLFLFLGALYMDPFLTGIFVFVLPPIAILIRKFGKRIRRASKRALHQYGVMLGAITEALQGLRVVKVHHTEGYERRRFNRINRRVLEHQMDARTSKALSSPIIETLSMVGLIVVVLIAAWTVFEQGKPTSTLVGVIVMLGGSAASFRQLTGLNNSLQEAAAAAENIDEVLHLPVEDRPRSDGERARDAMPRHAESVAFDHVTFAYPGSEAPVLRDVCLVVPHGSVCAVVGSNGSGKSTLLGLLPRLFEPDSGHVRIDSRDIATHTMRSLRRQIAMVTQDTVLFEGTIEENILYGSRHVGGEQLLDASRRAHAHDFIEAMPDGYHTEIGERGQRISGGQRQRIAIARAILRDPAILILDEATSQIDADSESKINAALAEFQKGRTTFVIAHRLSTVVDADMIVVMDAGKIAAVGKHAELLKTSEAYQTLCRTQLRGLDE